MCNKYLHESSDVWYEHALCSSINKPQLALSVYFIKTCNPALINKTHVYTSKAIPHNVKSLDCVFIKDFFKTTLFVVWFVVVNGHLWEKNVCCSVKSLCSKMFWLW